MQNLGINGKQFYIKVLLPISSNYWPAKSRVGLESAALNQQLKSG